MNAHEYAQENKLRFQEQLKELLRIPSISTLSEHAKDVERAAEWLIADMQRLGMHRAEIFQQEGFLPLVYGEWNSNPNNPTVLIYCHYDVQPAEMEDGWETNPFEPVEKEGKIFARGAVDSKSHVMAQLKAVESILTSENTPNINIKILFEGEEESGSEHIFQFVQNNQDLLQCDVCVVSDGSMPEVNQPVLVYGLRGLVAMELEVKSPERDLHSGHYGGTVHNPIQALAEILAQLHDKNGAVTVPGFYDNVAILDQSERDELKKSLSLLEQEWKAVANAPQMWGEAEYTLNERIGARPTLEINGIVGGFIREGIKTVLPEKALAKITCRLVPHQQQLHIFECIKNHIAEIALPSIQHELRLMEEGAPGVLIDRDTKTMQAASEAYTLGWGTRPLFTREGGSIPIVAGFKQELNSEIVIMSFGYKGCRAHGPNEHVYLEMFHKGIATAIYFLQKIGDSA